MEDVWKDISLSSVNDTPTTNPAYPATIFQDFFSRPFNHEPPSNNEETTFFGPPPSTILSLNSGSAFQYMGSMSSNSAANNRTTAVATPSLGPNPSLCRKRAQENDGDHRHKLMKYRESAARSRARKLAYRKELEHEAARLKEENAKLRKHQVKLLWAAPNQFPKKNSLRRTLTAPF